MSPTPISMQRSQRAVRCAVGSLAALMLFTTGCTPPQAQAAKTGRPGGKPDQEVKKERPFLAPTVVTTVRRREIESTVSTTGSAIPIRSRMLRAEEAGRLRFARNWREGDPVKAGELIATIESSTLDSEIGTAEADLDVAAKVLELGQKSIAKDTNEFRQQQELFTKGITPKRSVDQAEFALQNSLNQQRRSEIEYEKARIRLETLRERQERLKVLAPFDGLIVARTTLEGNAGGFTRSFGRETITELDGRLIAGEFGICGVVDTSTVLIRSDVTSRDISRIRPGQPARVLVYSTEDYVVEGRVLNISDSVDAETRAFSVDVEVANADGRLKPGMFGRLDIVAERRRDTVVVPKSIITRRNNREVVFVATREPGVDYDIAVERPIEVGLEGRDLIEVTNGLNAGDRLIIRGFEVLQDRTPISVLDADAPTTRTIVPDAPAATGS